MFCLRRRNKKKRGKKSANVIKRMTKHKKKVSFFYLLFVSILSVRKSKPDYCYYVQSPNARTHTHAHQCKHSVIVYECHTCIDGVREFLRTTPGKLSRRISFGVLSTTAAKIRSVAFSLPELNAQPDRERIPNINLRCPLYQYSIYHISYTRQLIYISFNSHVYNRRLLIQRRGRSKTSKLLRQKIFYVQKKKQKTAHISPMPIL